MTKAIEGWEELKNVLGGGNNLKFVVGKGVGDENGGLEGSKPFFGLAFVNIGWSRTQRKSRFWGHRRPLVTEVNRAVSGSCCKQRDVLVDKSHRNSRESIPWRSWSTVSNIFRHTKFLWREGDDEVRDIGKHSFRSVLLQPTSQFILHACLQRVKSWFRGVLL